MRRVAFMAGLVAMVLVYAGSTLYQRMLVFADIYRMQRYEKKKKELLDVRFFLTQEYAQLRDQAIVQRYAIDTLGMQQIAFRQAKRIIID